MIFSFRTIRIHDFFIRGQEILSGVQCNYDPTLLEERTKLHKVFHDV